ncbi:hypothetical protein IFR05_003524 [Cadophora sp. M221]|nr:hypothetical protein IFR05_003524 [Cadophora sp. M221]
MLKQYKLAPAFGTLVDFDNDIFMFDFPLLGIPFEYIRVNGGLPILQMPELAAKIKNLAIYDTSGPPLLPGGYGPGESWFPVVNQQQIKELFSSIERLLFVTYFEDDKQNKTKPAGWCKGQAFRLEGTKTSDSRWKKFSILSKIHTEILFILPEGSSESH